MKIVKSVLIVISILGIIQIIPYGKDKTNPEVQTVPKWDSKESESLFAKTCLDCHSNQTKWPWYSKIAPLSWIIYHNVKEGREHFNISMMGKQKKNKFEDAAEELEEGEMPPLGYVLFHPEAKLSDNEINRLIEGLKITFKKQD
jgi:hypothetical protein